MADEFERLIVMIEGRLDQFERAMRQAERTGTATYQKLQAGAFKATTAIEKQMLDSAKAQGRALESVFGQSVNRANKSARESAAAFREIERARAGIDQLRASLDPAFAAAMRFETAVKQLDAALESGAIDARAHAEAMALVKAAYAQAVPAADGQTAGLGRLGAMSDRTRWQLQQVGFNVQDMAIQFQGGARATQVLAQQGSQILSVFGPWGALLGTLAAVGLPIFGAALASAGDKAKSFDQAMGDVHNSVQAVNEAAANFTAEGMAGLAEKYGEVNAELMRFLDLQAQAAQVEAINRTRDAMGALADEMADWWSGEAWSGLQGVFDLTVRQANDMAVALRNAKDAATFEEQLAAVSELRRLILEATGGIQGMSREQFAFFQKVQESEDALRQLVATAPKAGWLAGMIGQAETLATKLWEAVKAKAQLAAEAAAPGMTTGNSDWAKNDLGFTLRGDELLGLPKGDGGTGSGGGRGGGGTSAIDGLIRDLQTEREIVAAWYEESLAAINGATEAQLAAIGGRHGAIERLEREHQDRLRGIRDESNGGALAQAETFLGGMATLFEAGGNRMVKAQRAVAAAEALINTLRAQAQVLADPKLSFWQKFPAVAAVAKAGAGIVKALGGNSGGAASSGASAGGAAGNTATEAAQAPLQVTMRGLNPKDLFTGQMVIDMYDAISKEAGNRGVVLV